MDWLPRGVRRAFHLPGGRSGRPGRREFDDELAFHLAMREAELREQGWRPQDARDEALRRYGDVHDARLYCEALDRATARTRRRRDWTAGWVQDVRSAVRQLRASPTLTAVAAVTLALGIGATTAIFSAVYGLLLAPLPYPGGDRVVALVRTNPESGLTVPPTWQHLEAWRASVRSLEGVTAYTIGEYTRRDGDTPEDLQGAAIEPALVRTFDLRPTLGRFFTPDESQPGAPPVVMLGYGYWQRAFGGRTTVIGETIVLGDEARTIVGVLPRNFVLVRFGLVRDHQVAVPLSVRSEQSVVHAIGRLRPGATAEMADRELTAVLHELTAAHGRTPTFGGDARHVQEFLTPQTQSTLRVLLMAVGVVLLIACVNVAALLLARAATRQRELAVRAALGAGRARLVRQLLTESVLLALVGGVAGLLVAWGGLHAIIALRPPNLDVLEGVSLQPVILGGSLLLSALTGLAFGLAPAFFAAEHGIAGTLAGAAQSAAGHRRSRRLRSALVGVEIAFSVVLLVCAGLLVRNVWQLQTVDLGFEPRGLTTLHVALVGERYDDPAARSETYRQLLERVRAIPGVTAASMGAAPPLGGIAIGRLEVEGHAAPLDSSQTILGWTAIQPGHLRVLGLPLREGRDLTDTTGKPVLVNESVARLAWPNSSALGQRIRTSPEGSWYRVVGVVGDVRLPGSAELNRRPQIYVPFEGEEGGQLLVRHEGDVAPTLAQLTAAIAGLDPEIRVRDVRTVRSALDGMLAGPRFAMGLLGAFAVVALMLAAVGLYGVMAYSVSQRTREIGVRLALGATAGEVRRMVLRQALVLSAVAVAVGLAASLGATRLVRSLLYGVSPLDPVAFSGAALLLLAIAALAAYLPARRASRVDPMFALRVE